MTEWEALEQNVRLLLERCQQQQAAIEALQRTNDEQRQEIMRSHTELTTLQQQYRQLKTAHTLSAKPEDREKAKQQISALIARVDQAIAVLKQ
ncbi:MAG: hypothetical protein MJZ58_02550 [Paludibacteraceae bacterium]|nr:hypothetical protein [Paludibacteraceae bacterium]